MTIGQPISDAELLWLRQQGPYWKEMHARAVARIEAIQKEHVEKMEVLREQLRASREEVERLLITNTELSALVKLRSKQAFGKKSERRSRKGKKKSAGAGEHPPGPGRRDQSHLPEKETTQDVPDEKKVCSCCGKPRNGIGDAVSEFIEIEVQGYRRRVRRPQYAKSCRCKDEPAIVAAPAPARLVPGSPLGVSVWVLVLLDKFLFQRPTYRLLAELTAYGISLPRSTLTEGMERLGPLFAPLADDIRDRVRAATLRQADETGWPVFVEVEGKTGHRWQLWVFLCEEAVYFKLSPTRSSAVIEEVLGAAAVGTLVVDRYSAYKAFVVRNGGKLLLAFCWAHVRRDFLTLEQTRPSLAAWAHAWVEQIDSLWQLNDCRVEARDQGRDDSTEQQAVVRQVALMKKAWSDQLIDSAKLDPAQRKALKSLKRHWEGLTLFVENPEIPMDNNGSERQVRGPVVGRKNYYGSRAEWSGLLAATLFSVFQTLERHGINPKLWLSAYLNACADNGGKAPADAVKWLPWNLSDERRVAFDTKPKASEHAPKKTVEPQVLRSDFQPPRAELDPPTTGRAVAA